MILVDTNVFVDIWTNDPRWSEWSSAAVAVAASETRLVVNPIIYAELCLGFDEESQLAEALASADVKCLSLPCRAAGPASRAFAEYRARGGSRRTPLPDFFIGAHAEAESIRLLTRDAARYRTYFPRVQVIAPQS